MDKDPFKEYIKQSEPVSYTHLKAAEEQEWRG